MEKISKTMRKTVILLFWLALWQVASSLVGNPLLLPSPWQSVCALGDLAAEKVFYADIGWTAWRCVLAMVLSFAAGAAAAVCSYRSAVVRNLLSLPTSFFKAVPVMAIVIYVILLAKADWVAVIVCFFMCFPIVYTNILSGLDCVDAGYKEAAAVYGLSGFQKVRHIFIPSVMPHIKSAISLIAGLSWKAVVAAEVLSIPTHSLGYRMINSKYYLETDKLFAYIIVIVCLSMAFEKLINACLSRIEWRSYEKSRVLKHKASERAAEKKLEMQAQAIKAQTDEAGLGIISQAKPEVFPEICLQGISKSFGEKLVLDDVSMIVKGGEVTALMGASGIGKTTIARIAAGLEACDSGKVYRKGEPFETAFLFQEDRLLPWLNVYDNIAIGAAGKLSEQRVKQLAAELEIGEVLYRLPEELSGGMKHRVAIARTFAANGDFIVLDEIFRGLDKPLTDRIIERMWHRETAGKTVLLITHSSEDADRLADRVVVDGI